jgi:hypothetical protein
LLDLVRGLDRASCLDPAKRGKHVLGIDGGDRQGADNRKDVPFEPGRVLLLSTGGPICGRLRQPCARDRLERMQRCRCPGLLLSALGSPGISPPVQQSAGGQPLVAGLGESYYRIFSKGQPVFLPFGCM